VGLLLGMELSAPAKDIVQKCLQNGLLLITAGERVIRFAPPLNISESEVDLCVSILDGVLSSL